MGETRTESAAATSEIEAAWLAGILEKSDSPLIDPGELAPLARAIGLGDEPTAGLLACLRQVGADERLLRLARAVRARIFEERHWSAPLPDRWPRPDALGERADLFAPLAVLAGVDAMYDRNRARGIEDRVAVETLRDLMIQMREFHEATGRWGLSDEALWIVRFCRGHLFRLGRLQYEMQPFPLDAHVFRNLVSDRVLALAGDGTLFRSDGFYAGGDQPPDPNGEWTSRFERTDREIVGSPFDARGRAGREPVRLNAGEWRQEVGPDDPSVTIHIPADGPLDHAACGDSIRRAIDFFPRHFPEYPSRVFTCRSWLMDTQLEDCLGKDDNLVRFLREFMLLPHPLASDRLTVRFVLGNDWKTLDDAPRRTRLQRRTVDHLRRGLHWRIMTGIFFPGDLRWGEQVYRKSRMGCDRV